MCKFLLAQGFVILGITSADDVLATEQMQTLSVQDTAAQSSSASWLGAEAMEIILEVAVVIVIFGMSTPLLARIRRRPAKLPGNKSFSGAQLQSPTKGRIANGSLMKAASTFAAPQSVARYSTRAVERPRFQLSTNAAASRCQSERLFQFIAINQLDGCCSRMLRDMSEPMLEWVMDQEFVVRHAVSTSVVVARTVAQAHQLPEEFWESYPSPSDLARRLSTFIALNHLDVRCAKTLERLPLDTLRLVMDHEFVVQVDSTRGTASAKVVGHIMRISRY